jgi:hypothetical protein
MRAINVFLGGIGGAGAGKSTSDLTAKKPITAITITAKMILTVFILLNVFILIYHYLHLLEQR